MTKEEHAEKVWQKMIRNACYPLTINNMYGMMGKDGFTEKAITNKSKEIFRQMQEITDEHFKKHWEDELPNR